MKKHFLFFVFIMFPLQRQDVQFVRDRNQNDEHTAFIDGQLHSLSERQMTHAAALNRHFPPEHQAEK